MPDTFRNVIAVVHDAEAIRAALTALLRAEGFDVRAASRGSEALLLAAARPDLFVLDTDFQDVDGFEVCRRLKANPVTASIPVLLLSATCRSAEDRGRALGVAGADAYLVEPVDPRELASTIHGLLRVRRAEAEARAASAVFEFARSLGATREPRKLAKVIAQRAARILGVSRCTVGLLGDGGVVFTASQFADGHRDEALAAAFAALGQRPLDEVPAIAAAIRSRQPAVVEDVRTAAAAPPAWMEPFGVRAVLVVPLLHDHAAIGILAFDRTDGPGAFSPDAVTLATALAGQAALAIENARLHRRARERSARLRALGEVSRAIAATGDSREVFHIVARAAARLLGAKMTHVWLDDPAEQVLKVRGSFGIDPQLEQLSMDFFAIPYGRGLVGQVFAQRAPAYVLDIQRDPRWMNRRLAVEAGLHAYAGIPLVAGSRVLGALSIIFGERAEFTDEDRDVIEVLAHHVAVAVRNA